MVWFWQTDLNVKKSQMLMMSRKKNLKPKGDVILCNEAIQRVTKAKFLGAIVDEHQHWKDHSHNNGITQISK